MHIGSSLLAPGCLLLPPNNTLEHLQLHLTHRPLARSACMAAYRVQRARSLLQGVPNLKFDKRDIIKRGEGGRGRDTQGKNTIYTFLGK